MLFLVAHTLAVNPVNMSSIPLDVSSREIHQDPLDLWAAHPWSMEMTLCAGATYLYENYVGPGFHKLRAEARKVPALQKLMDGDAPKTT